MSKTEESDGLSWADFVDRQLKPLLQASRLREALSLLECFLIRDPDHIDCIMTIGNLYRVSRLPNRHAHAVHYYRLAQERKKFYLPAYRAEAEAHLDFGKKNEALEKIKTALFLDDGDEDLWKIYEKLKEEDCGGQLRVKPDIVMYTGHPLDRLESVSETPGLIPYPHELHDRPLGGSESVFLLMARTLAGLGKRVALFGNFVRPMMDGGIECLDTRDFFTYRRREEVPVAIVSRFYQPFLGRFRARRRILWLHDSVTGENRSNYQMMDGQVDEYWILSDYQREAYLKNCGLNGDKFWKTTNAVDLALFGEPLPRQKRVRGQLIYCSRPSRGLDLLIPIFKELRSRLPHLTLKVCTYTAFHGPEADPEIAPFLPQISGQPGISFHLLGKKELIQEIKKSELMIYPNSSDLETSCLAAIEAQAAGTPILASDRGCLKETVRPGETGILIPWNAERERLIGMFVEAAGEILADEARRDLLSRKAFEYAQSRFDSKSVAGEWLKHLEEYL